MDEDLRELSAAELRERAWGVLRTAEGDPRELAALARRLKAHDMFKEARRILERARRNPEGRAISEAERLWLTQQQALCTYKDPDIPAHEALDSAFRLLQAEADLTHTRNQETLGLAGAILKRQYQVDGAKEHLEGSLAYYLRGYAEGVAGDQGYTGINAAYVLDLLAHVEENQTRRTGGTVAPAVERRRREARDIRRRLVEELAAPDLQERYGTRWWFRATQAEAHFGLGRYEDPAAVSFEDSAYAMALRLLIGDEADPLPRPSAWEFESTARQLASLAQLHVPPETDIETTRAWRMVERLLHREGAEALRSVFYGKLGLGLSGGGFRASLFHIGVLARLAELDVLRHAHVVSCVSGGSILGAYYYLEIRRLLTSKRDEEITREDYIDVVARMAREFVHGVQRNMRTRLIGSIGANLRMILSGSYSRTERLGELLEDHIYARIGDDGQRTLDELRIVPRGAPADFDPKRDNWLRRNKVPILVLNATSLNTGHNWQFTTSFMGESPFAIDEEIDGNWRLRRLYYRDAPEDHRRVPLGKAVGASACVPGLFEPIALSGLYRKQGVGREGIVVRLVDGGVHDNQGVVSLIEQDCSVLVCSDASGQMTSDPEPSGGVLGPVLRTNSALMERVRQAQFQDLKARRRTGLLRGLMILHLKKAFDVEPIDWVTCEEPTEEPLRREGDLLPYEISKPMQELLAGVRTDLDSFSDIEAQALMTSGYRMASRYAEDLGDFPRRSGESVDWEFLRLSEPLRSPGHDAASRGLRRRVEKILAVAGKKAFKVWLLSPPLLWISRAVAAIAAVTALAALWLYRDRTLLEITWWNGRQWALSVGGVFWGLVVAASPLVLGKVVAWVVDPRQSLRRVALGAGLGIFGGVVAKLHLWVFDRLYLALGRLGPAAGRRSPEGPRTPGSAG